MKRILCAVAVFFAIAGSSLADTAADQAKRDDRVSYLLGLMDQQRYAETAQGVQQLFIDFPDDVGSYEVRGLLEMHVGAFQAAQRDFQFAASIADGSDPVPSYALGLCSIALRDYDNAERHLTDAAALANDSERPDVRFADAILAVARGDYADAPGDMEGITTPAAIELAALMAFHESHGENIAPLQAFVDAAKVNGIPRVIEDPGLRLLGPSPKDGSITIEPALTEAVLQSMFDDRLSYENAPLSADVNNVVMGSVTLRPMSDPVMATKSNVTITASVDGHLLGMVNTTPYQFTWDTRKTPNGDHTVTFDLADSDGTVFATQKRSYKVANAGSQLAHATLPFSQAVVDQIWAKLQLHPAYKTAEYALAQAYFERKDRANGVSHLLVTAALDSDYYNVGNSVTRIFHGDPAQVMRLASTDLPTVPTKSDAPIELWRGSPNIKEMALTFDDGPTRAGCLPLLDALKKANAVATFFVVGIRVVVSPDVIRRMVADGHEVESHTYTHPNLDEAIPEHIREEYLRNGVAIDALTGRWPRFLRPPGGNSNPEVMQIAMECGMIGGFWTLDALNAEDTDSPEVVANYVIGHAKNGAVVLMHNDTKATYDAVPAIVAGLRAKGYKLVTLAQMARDAGINIR